MTPGDEAEEFALAAFRDRLSYKPAEAARLLGVDERTVYRLIASGELAARRVSSRLTLISRQALYDFLGFDAQPTAREAVQ